MSKDDTRKSKTSTSRRSSRSTEPRLSDPIAVTKQLAGNKPQPQPQPLYCCSGPRHQFGGGGASGSWIVTPGKRPGQFDISGSLVAKPGKNRVTVEKAVAKLFSCSPCVLGGKMCLCLEDGRLICIDPKGVFSIFQSADDKEPIVSSKSVAAVMLLKRWTFQQALKWMKVEFGASATQNSGQEYVEILLLGDE